MRGFVNISANQRITSAVPVQVWLRLHIEAFHLVKQQHQTRTRFCLRTGCETLGQGEEVAKWVRGERREGRGTSP